LGASDPEGPLRTRFFDFYFRGTSAASHPNLIENADQVATRLAAELGQGWTQRTRVLVAGSLDDFRASLPAKAELSPEVVGVALGRENLIVLRNHPRLPEVFAHEASHIALFRATGGRPLPRWFVEGFAAYQAGEGSFDRLASLIRASVSNTLIPLRDLEHHFPARADASDLAYAQSAELVSYLLGTYGRGPFRALLRRIAAGEPFFKALVLAYRVSVEDLEEQYLRDLGTRYNWVPIVTGTATLWMGITLVFLLAYFRKRRAMRHQLARLDQEEATAEEPEKGPPQEPTRPPPLH
jgi:hypothetical protein